jgi:hypothetical protein
VPGKPTARSEFRLQLSGILLGILGVVAYAVCMFPAGLVSVVITVVGLLGLVLAVGLLIWRLKRFGPIVKTVATSPLAGLMHRYFDSISRAPAIKNPLLVLIGAANSTNPSALSQKLAGQWGGANEIKTYPGEDHDLLLHANSSWADIGTFLQTLARE